MALIDNEGDMIAICKSPETYKPKVGNGAMKDLYLKFIIEVSNVEKVTLVVDPTAIFLTKKDEEKIKTSITNLDKKTTENNTATNKKIDDTKKELNEKIGDTTQLITTDKTNIVSAINEVKTSVDSIETTAEKTSYNNATSNLTATTVQNAIDEIVVKQNELNTEVNGQRIKGISIANSLDMI